MAKRLFQLARELGVESKAIIEKCQAESLDVANHMASVSAGLEATIRDWFSDESAGGGTAVETAAKVDLTKVKAKARRRAKPAKAEPKPEEPAPEKAAEAAPQAPAAAPAAAAETAAPVEPPAPAEAEAAPAEEAAPQEPAPAVAAEVEQPAEPPKPEPPKVAGPQVTPETAKLKGPKVIRVEEPEPDRRVRRGPAAAPQPSSEPPLRSTGPRRGGGAGAGTPKDGDDDAGRSPRRKKRTGTRKGRTAEAELWDRNVRREQDLLEREQRLSRSSGFLKRRRRDMKKRAEGGTVASTPAEVGGTVEIAEPFTIKDLSAATGIKAADIITFLFNKGIVANINAIIDTDAAMEVCLDYDIELSVKEAQTAEQQMEAAVIQRDRADERRRPPVVAVLGHVDHGKTSLLDRIRTTDVAAGEAGGITQHIGAFRVTITGGDGAEKSVVFLDTPGHQAFTNMRARGATLADLVVLVVAADDGVMPQTIESIDHARAAGVPIVVALNKIDRPEATDNNIQRILGQLAEHELNPVEWGGDVEVMRVSAQTGDGITDLVEVLDYQAELLELKADYEGPAYGQVIEAELSTGRGCIARVLVQEGQLHVGDFVVIGRAFGKVRAMIDDHGKSIDVAGPATPVEISGINQVPDAGDKLYATETLAKAEQIAEQRLELDRKEELATQTKVSLDNVFERIQEASIKELRVVVKADVQGSVEVLRKTLEELGNDQVRVRVLHAAVGGVTESDVLLAEASDAVIIGFQVISSPKARSEAERRGVDVRTYRVIYDITDDVTRALEGMLSPEKREEVLGHAEVREVFRVSKVGAVAGCYITDGVVRRSALIRVTRDDIIIEHDRVLNTLKRFKDDAREVRAGMECGMSIENYDDIHVGDVLECYVTTEVKATLS